MEYSYSTATSEADWNEWVKRNAAVVDGGLSIARTTSIREADLGVSVVDHAVDPTGVLYTVHDSGALYRYDPATDLHQRLIEGSEPSIDRPCAVCASENRVYVADAADGSIATLSPRLQRELGQLPCEAADPRTLRYADGVVYVVDGDDRLVTVGGEAELTVDWWLQSPIDLAVCAGRMYVLDETSEGRTVRAFDAEEERREGLYPLSTGAFVTEDASFTPTAIAVPSGSLVVAGTFDDRDGHGLFEWDPDQERFTLRHELARPCVDLVGQPTDEHSRRVFYALLGEERASYALQEVGEYARHPKRDRHVGVAFHRFDAGRDAVEWHRIALDIARASASTQVRLRYVATDEAAIGSFDAEGLATEGLDPSAIEALRESGVDSLWALATAAPTELAERSDRFDVSTIRSWCEAAGETLADHADARWTLVETIDPEETLLRDATGRYLYVAVELVGTPTAAPLVDSVTAYCPRQSYLRHLPEVYQEDDRSATFLERFLSVFETSFVEIEREIEGFSRYMDPGGVPSESLEWLETWLAADDYRSWPESARRELLARAPELYRKRGTKAGLRAMLELYLSHTTDEEWSGPERATAERSDRSRLSDATGTESDASSLSSGRDIDQRLFFLEPGDLDCIENEAAKAQFASLLPGPRSFALCCGPFDSAEQREAVEHIVETETPAHVTAQVLPIEDEFTLGVDTFLGVNSALRPRAFAMGEAALGEDTVLGPGRTTE
ncbi:phage tail protein [Halovivax ruber XH-70]|uniref:Phage tail protein n=1 Tax=Halovivax ruber (strain DSM 18193 / JCM 13892 / XH-70) TaxID=797302 RepID=L0I7Y5_HALRX|nr:phage tail protein [Halovivax ruber]AGB14789.1 phage tail protein [Halovivax ruber XH-70]